MTAEKCVWIVPRGWKTNACGPTFDSLIFLNWNCRGGQESSPTKILWPPEDYAVHEESNEPYCMLLGPMVLQPELKQNSPFLSLIAMQKRALGARAHVEFQIFWCILAQHVEMNNFCLMSFALAPLDPELAFYLKIFGMFYHRILNPEKLTSSLLTAIFKLFWSTFFCGRRSLRRSNWHLNFVYTTKIEDMALL